jgi:hypothetical protein
MVKNVCGAATVCVSLALADCRLSVTNCHVGVDTRHARGLALDHEALRHVAVGSAQCRRQRDCRAAVGELEVGLQRQGTAVSCDAVALLADGLLEFVQPKLAGLVLRRGLGKCDGRREGKQKNAQTKTIHADGSFSTGRAH